MPNNIQRRRAGFHRAELLEVLYTAVSKNPNIRMHVNKRLSGVKKVSDKEMELEFQDRTTATTNLVVGADGIHSVVRSHYLKDEAIFSGYVAYRGLIPMDKVQEFWPYDDSDVSGFWTQQGKHFMTYTPPLPLLTKVTLFLPTAGSSILLHSLTGIRIPPKQNHGSPKPPNRKSLRSTKGGIQLSKN
jgi:2-polyprenyl-6-methoxyphenol hydroxylase-like FAD-dependent oxidoreductase